VSPHDPLAFGLALVVMVIASLTACFRPRLARDADRSGTRAKGMILTLQSLKSYHCPKIGKKRR
jgi:hypothetical protein